MPPKKRNYKRRKQFKKNKPKLLSLGPYMPQSIIAKHKMSTVFSLSQDYQTTGIGTNNRHNFRINALNDADLESGSRQPRMFDEMSAMYNTYRVLGCRVNVKFINISGEPVYCLIVPGSQQITTATDPQSVRELKGSQSRICHSVDSGPRSVINMSYNYSPERIEGRPKRDIRGNPDFEALHSNVPTELHYLSIMAHQVSTTLGGQNNATVQVEVTFNWTALWNDRKFLDDSN
ncbi:MAG: coat protein [Cressdnaviricota sp.]|nr:MAG: coat protein [Cressdnaviricota sp.]